MHRPILLALVIMILTGCGGSPFTRSASPQPSNTAEVAPPPTDTPAPTVAPITTDVPTPTTTLLPTPTVTLPPTETPLPTPTAEPTASPTPSLPVGPGASLPQPLQPITADNVTTIRELARVGTARVYSTVISADRSRLFSLTGEGIKVYQADTMERLAWFTEVMLWQVFSTSADGSRLALFNTQRQVLVYDIQDGLIFSITPAGEYSWAALSPDGRYLALPQLGEDEWIPRWQVVDITDGSIVADGVGMNARFSPAGTYLAADASDNLYIYSTADWQELTQIGLRAGGVTAMDWSFSPDDRYLAAVMRSRVTVWSVADRKRVREFQPVTAAEAEISQAFFSEESSQVAVVEYFGREANLLIWNIVDGSLASRQATSDAGLYNYDQVFLDADGLHGYQVPRESDGSGYQAPQWTGWQAAFDLTSDGLSVVDYSGWDDVTQQPTYKACTFPFSPATESFCQEVSGAMGMTTDSRGHFYSLWQEQDDKVSLYNGLEQSGTPLTTFSTKGHPINLLGVAPNQGLLVYTVGKGGSTLQVRDLSADSVLFTEDMVGRIESVRFSADGMRMAVSINNSENLHPQVLVYDAVQNAVLFRLPAQDMMMGRSAVISPDGGRLAYRFERWDALRWRGIQVWEPLHQRELAAWEGFVDNLGNPMAFSPDGKLLATMDNIGRIFLLDAETGDVLHAWAAHVDAVLSLAFSVDGTLLATAGTDGFLRVWGVWP